MVVKKCKHARAGEECACAWWGDVRVDGLRVWRNLGRDEREARRLYERLKGAAQTGIFPTRTTGDGFRTLARRWETAAANRLRASTMRGYRYSLSHAVRYFGDGSVISVTPATITELEGVLLTEGLSPGYVLNVRKTVLHVLGFAVDAGLLGQVPSMRRYPISDAERTPVFLEPDQMEAVLGVAPVYWRSLFEMGWLTGLRPGELVALETARWDGEQIHVRRSWNANGTGIGPVKTRRSIRSVDLSHRAQAALEAAPRGKPLRKVRALDGLPVGERFWPRAYRTALEAWHGAMAAAGLDPCGLHACRHSNVALRLAAGQDVQYVADQLGHASAGFTLKVYGHLIRRRVDPASLDDAVARLTRHGASSPP